MPAREIWEEALARPDGPAHDAVIRRTSTLRAAAVAGSSIVSRRLGVPVRRDHPGLTSARARGTLSQHRLVVGRGQTRPLWRWSPAGGVVEAQKVKPDQPDSR